MVGRKLRLTRWFPGRICPSVAKSRLPSDSRGPNAPVPARGKAPRRGLPFLLLQRSQVGEHSSARWRRLCQQHLVALQNALPLLLQILTLLRWRALPASQLDLCLETPPLADDDLRSAFNARALSHGRHARCAVPPLAIQASLRDDAGASIPDLPWRAGIRLFRRPAGHASVLAPRLPCGTRTRAGHADTVPQVRFRRRGLRGLIGTRSVQANPVPEIRCRLFGFVFIRRILPNTRGRSDPVLPSDLLIRNNAAGAGWGLVCHRRCSPGT